jgi:hypothetical protein
MARDERGSGSGLVEVPTRVWIAVEGETRHDLDHGRPMGVLYSILLTLLLVSWASAPA